MYFTFFSDWPFYSKFTPEHVTDELVKEINGKPSVQNEAREVLKKIINRTIANEENPRPRGITARDVEEILVEMEILIRE